MILGDCWHHQRERAWRSPSLNLAKICHHCLDLMPPKIQQILDYLSIVKRIFNNRNMLMTIMRSIFMYYEIPWSSHRKVQWSAHGISLTISMRCAWKKNFRLQTTEFFRAKFSQCSLTLATTIGTKPCLLEY